MAVTDYVREEFNRAEALANARRTGTVGFALTILQRRLASSPEASYQSLRRRRERLERAACASSKCSSGAASPSPVIAFTAPELDADDVENLDDAPEQEVEDAEARILDRGVEGGARHLKALESLALGVRRRSADTKWRELASLFVPAPAARVGFGSTSSTSGAWYADGRMTEDAGAGGRRRTPCVWRWRGEQPVCWGVASAGGVSRAPGDGGGGVPGLPDAVRDRRSGAAQSSSFRIASGAKVSRFGRGPGTPRRPMRTGRNPHALRPGRRSSRIRARCTRC